MLERFLVTVPQLEGRAFNPEALGSSLDRIGLRLGNAIPVADNEREGMIISQNPAARQRVPMQTAVDITYGVPVPGGGALAAGTGSGPRLYRYSR